MSASAFANVGSAQISSSSRFFALAQSNDGLTAAAGAAFPSAGAVPAADVATADIAKYVPVICSGLAQNASCSSWVSTTRSVLPCRRSRSLNGLLAAGVSPSVVLIAAPVNQSSSRLISDFAEQPAMSSADA